MDTVYRVCLEGMPEELAGYGKITPAIIRKKILSYSLNLGIRGRLCRLNLGQECGFCKVSVRPEIYISAGENLRQIHGNKGFCFKGLLAYDIGGEWLTDTEKEYLVIYEPFSEELHIVLLKTVSISQINPVYKFWNRVTEMYFVKAQDEVRLYRQFLVRGNSLVASDDILMSQSHDAGAHHYYYFAPMSFVYHPLWTAKDLADKPLEELKKLTK